jgi:hypothetical protein
MIGGAHAVLDVGVSAIRYSVIAKKKEAVPVSCLSQGITLLNGTTLMKITGF